MLFINSILIFVCEISFEGTWKYQGVLDCKTLTLTQSNHVKVDILAIFGFRFIQHEFVYKIEDTVLHQRSCKKQFFEKKLHVFYFQNE